MPNWESDPTEPGYDPGIDPDLEDYEDEYSEGYSDPDTGETFDRDGELVDDGLLYGADHVMTPNECRWAGTWYSADELAVGLTDEQKRACDSYGKDGYYDPIRAPDLGGAWGLDKAIKFAAYGGAVLLGLRLAKVI